MSWIFIASRTSKFIDLTKMAHSKNLFIPYRKIPSQNSLLVTKKFDWVSCGGDDQTRTDYLYVANVSLYRVSYIPVFRILYKYIAIPKIFQALLTAFRKIFWIFLMKQKLSDGLLVKSAFTGWQISRFRLKDKFKCAILNLSY